MIACSKFFPDMIRIMSLLLLFTIPVGAQDGEFRLAVLREEFDKKKAEIYSSNKDLDARYEQGLKRLQQSAQTAGDLELALAARGEAEVFRERGGRAIEPSKHGKLAKLQKIYIEQSAKIAAERKAKLAPIAIAYRKRLDALVSELTKAGKLDQALLAKTEHTRITAFINAAKPAPIQAEKKGHLLGRYVRIEVPRSTALNVAEVQIISGGKNIARRGKATQSSIYGSADAEKAIDGETDGDLRGAGSTACTKIESNPWWEVDLRSEKELTQIVIWNRTDSGESRLKGAKLSVLGKERTPVWERVISEAPDPDATFELIPSAE